MNYFDKIIGKKLTFDDVLLLPSYSKVLPANTSTTVRLSKNITLSAPIISAAMDTVTESQMAIAMAQSGGIGCIHKNMTIQQQVAEVRKVKRFESGIVLNPITVSPTLPLTECLNIMRNSGVSGLPVVESSGRLVGIITNRDVMFVSDLTQKVYDLMTKDNLVTVKQSITKEEAKKLLHKHRIERLIVVDENYFCIGLITSKDIEYSSLFPYATKDINERLSVGASIGVTSECFERGCELVENGVDMLVIDTAHGNSEGVIEATRKLSAKFGSNQNITIVAGNIATADAVCRLADAGAHAVKVGIGPGSICTTRIVTGVGAPQLSAIMECAQEAAKRSVSVIADGGMKYSGDVAKALAAGACAVMSGTMFAGTEESPGETILHQGKFYKTYYGMGSLRAMNKGSSDRYFQDSSSNQKFVPEGVEGRVPFKGKVKDVMHQLTGGLRAAMGYTGCKNMEEFWQNTKFVEITSAALKESHAHDIIITQESPNYSNS